MATVSRQEWTANTSFFSFSTFNQTDGTPHFFVHITSEELGKDINQGKWSEKNETIVRREISY